MHKLADETLDASHQISSLAPLVMNKYNVHKCEYGLHWNLGLQSDTDNFGDFLVSSSATIKVQHINI